MQVQLTTLPPDHSTTSCQPMDKILGKSIEWFLRYLVFSTSTGIKFRPIKQAFKCVLKQLWPAHMISNDLKNIPSKACPITPCGSKVMRIWSCWGRCVPIPLNIHIKHTKLCRQHNKRKDRNIWHHYRVSRKFWFSHNFFLLYTPPPHSQKQKASKESTSNGWWNGWFDEASSTANWRTHVVMMVHVPPTVRSPSAWCK